MENHAFAVYAHLILAVSLLKICMHLLKVLPTKNHFLHFNQNQKAISTR